MAPVSTLPTLLAAAWLIPLASFVVILFFGPRMGKAGKYAGYLATGAIASSCAISLFALFLVWLPANGVPKPVAHHAAAEHGHEAAVNPTHGAPADGAHEATDHAEPAHGDAHAETPHGNPLAVKPITGDWYTLGKFGSLRLTIGYYIDSLTLLMFAMVTVIATCIHFMASVCSRGKNAKASAPAAGKKTTKLRSVT